MTERTHSSTTEPTSTSLPTTGESLGDGVARLTDRRGVLKVAGVVVGAGALAACSSPAVPTDTAASSSGGSTPAESSSSATSGASSEATSSAAAGGTPTSEIPVGGGKVFPDTKTVVTQPTAGTFKAFDAVCPHQGCTVGSVDAGQIVCPCHQSHFDAATGNRVSGPAQTGLTAKQITVTGDTFTVS